MITRIRRIWAFILELFRGKKRRPGAISLPTMQRPTSNFNEVNKKRIGDSSVSTVGNNSLPYVVLSELYGLRDYNDRLNDLTIDIDALISEAEQKSLVVHYPLGQDGINLVRENREFEGYLRINYIHQFSSDYDPKHMLNVLEVNERMFRHPDRELWIYNYFNYGDGLKLYRIFLRRNIQDLDDVVIGDDVMTESFEATNEELKTLMERNEDVYRLLTGEYSDRRAPHPFALNGDPADSDYSGTTIEEKESEEGEESKEIDDYDDEIAEGFEKVTLGQFGGVEGASSLVKKLPDEPEGYEPDAFLAQDTKEAKGDSSGVTTEATWQDDGKGNRILVEKKYFISEQSTEESAEDDENDSEKS